MASSSSLFLIVSLSLAFFFSTTQADLISTVCSKSNNPSLCDQILRSDPRSRNGDLRSIGRVAIDRARSAIQGARVAVKAVKNNRNKEYVETCLEVFEDAIYELDDCSKALESNAMRDLSVYADAVMTYVTTCDDEYVGEPATVRQATGRANDIADVLLVVSCEGGGCA